jgi:hypothetical protein
MCHNNRLTDRQKSVNRAESKIANCLTECIWWWSYPAAVLGQQYTYIWCDQKKCWLACQAAFGIIIKGSVQCLLTCKICHWHHGQASEHWAWSLTVKTSKLPTLSSLAWGPSRVRTHWITQILKISSALGDNILKCTELENMFHSKSFRQRWTRNLPHPQLCTGKLSHSFTFVTFLHLFHFLYSFTLVHFVTSEPTLVKCEVHSLCMQDFYQSIIILWCMETFLQ